MRRAFLGASLALCGLVIAAGCQKTDLGFEPCYLTKKNPDGGAPLRVKEGEIMVGGQDVISLAAIECDDFICVRDFGTPKTGDPNADLTGYCTHACSNENTTVGCESDLNQVRGRPYQCRGLLMDRDTLLQLCVDNPSLCTGSFGNQRSALFCARGLADGGQP